MNTTKKRPTIWHCIFCGKHGSRDDFQVPFSLYGKDKTKTCCSQCREYKGLEICDPATCNCWTLDVVRKLAENCTGCKTCKYNKTCVVKTEK